MTWVPATTPWDGRGVNSAQVTGIAWADDLQEFFAAGVSSMEADTVLRSSDGITWTAVPSLFSQTSFGISNGVVRSEVLGLWVVVGDDGSEVNTIQTSHDDGATWIGRGNPFNAFDGNTATCVAVKPSTGFLIAGGQTFGADDAIATSPDGATWTPRSCPVNGTVNAIAYSSTHNRWIAVGQNSIGGPEAAYSDNDGTTWTAISSNPLPDVNQSVYYDVTIDRWFMVGVDFSSNNVAYSDNNGATWTAVEALDGPVAYCVIRAGSDLALGVNGIPEMGYSTNNGATWNVDGTPTPFVFQYPYCFAYSSSLGLAVVGGIDENIAIAYGLPGAAPDPPPGISIAPTSNPLDDPAIWTRLDTIDGLNITDVSITRGRPDERSKTSPASVSVKGNDLKGILDPTNPSSPFHGHLDPVKQAAISMWNPANQTWNWIFRGYISDITLSFDTDTSESFMDFELTFTDMLDLLNDSEVIPDSAGNLAPTENVGDTFYTGQHCDDRLLAVLADSSTAFYDQIWPVSLLEVASGNVFVQGRAYSNQTSLLQVIDEACDAEYPYGTNRFITKNGAFAFRGRYYRFVPNFYTAFDGNRRTNHEMLQWNVVDMPSYSVGSSQAIAQTITFTRGKTNLINAALITPVNIRQDQIAAQAVHDSTSIGKYGPRTSGLSLENLITSDADDGNNPIQEDKSFAQAIVDNYKNPVTRISQLKFTNPTNNTNDEGQNLWHILTNIELSDLIIVNTQHPGGGGFSNSGYFVEQITYDIQPLRGDIWQVQLTLDLTSQEFYNTMPSSWKPPIVGGLNAAFDFSYSGMTLNFTDESTPGPSGPITAWHWDFGDGSTSTLQNPSHTYGATALYDVKLTVTGTGGDGTDSATNTVYPT